MRPRCVEGDPLPDDQQTRGHRYLTVPAYAAFHQWLGRGELIKPMLDLWAAGDRRGASAAVPDEVVDDLVVHGDLETCRERVDQYRQAGLDTPVIAILPGPGIDVAQAVRGLRCP